MLNKILLIYKKFSIQAKASMWFIVCSIFQKGISTITVPIFTRLMSTEEYGVYTLYLSWLNILTIFTSLNLYYEVFSSALVKLDNDKAKKRYISSMQGLSCLLWVICFFVIQFFKDFFVEQFDLSSVIIDLMLIELFVAPSMQYWLTKNKFEFKYKSIVIVTLIKSILNPVIGIIAVVISVQKDVARIVSIVCVEVAICGTIMTIQFIQGKCFYDRKNWKYALSFGVPLIPHYLSGTILSQSDKIMINRMIGSTELALYGLGSSIGSLLQIFTTAFNASLSPTIFIGLKEKKYKDMVRTQNGLLICTAGLIFAFSLVAPEAAIVFGGGKYADAKYIIIPIIASVYFKFLYNSFANIEFYFEKKEFILITTIAVTITNIILNYVFIRLFGYIAAAYTTLFCDFLFAFGHCYFSFIIWKKERNEGYPFNLKLIWFIGLCIFVEVILLNFLYSHFVIRYCIAVACIILMIIYRKKIFALLRKVT